jgi:hypothetical protein
MKPVLFLDIDGVLTSWANAVANPSTGSTLTDPQLDRACVARVNRIVAETGCEVVVCSTLRRQPRARVALTRVLREFGATFDVEDVTPYIPRAPRGNEIAAWIDANHFTGPFAVLDDSSLNRADGKDYTIAPDVFRRWVKPWTDKGVTDAEADQCIALLKEPIS